MNEFRSSIGNAQPGGLGPNSPGLNESCEQEASSLSLSFSS